MIKDTSKEFQCDDKTCGYTSPRTHLVIFEGIENRFCAKCYLKFLQGLVTKVPAAIGLPTKKNAGNKKNTQPAVKRKK